MHGSFEEWRISPRGCTRSSTRWLERCDMRSSCFIIHRWRTRLRRRGAKMSPKGAVCSCLLSRNCLCVTGKALAKTIDKQTIGKHIAFVTINSYLFNERSFKQCWWKRTLRWSQYEKWETNETAFREVASLLESTASSEPPTWKRNFKNLDRKS